MEETTTLISGLRCLREYLSAQEHDRFLATVDQQPWITDLRRRVQHYGYRYDYKSNTVDPAMFLGPLPEWLAGLAERLHRDSYVARVPDQVIVNEYEPGQGIGGHVDCVPCFGETVLSLTLGSGCEMVFKSLRSEEQVRLFVEPRSLVVMSGEARYHWKHGIPGRKTDVHAGKTVERGRRVSLTFRTVIVQRGSV